jgi:hypothetical protein
MHQALRFWTPCTVANTPDLCQPLGFLDPCASQAGSGTNSTLHHNMGCNFQMHKSVVTGYVWPAIHQTLNNRRGVGYTSSCRSADSRAQDTTLHTRQDRLGGPMPRKHRTKGGPPGSMHRTACASSIPRTTKRAWEAAAPGRTSAPTTTANQARHQANSSSTATHGPHMPCPTASAGHHRM